ncbi:MAG TPA: PIN domain-containing protein [Thermoanaerobaculia bacterium]
MGSLTRIFGKKLYVDANLFIYAIEAAEPWVEVARQILHYVDDKKISVVTSELSLAECLVKPFQLGNQETIDIYLNLFLNREHLTVVPVSRDLLVQAATLRAGSRMKLPDAIHAATAIKTECDLLLTNDDRFKTLKNPEMLFLGDIEI